MAALPGRHNSWSAFATLLQWCRDWAEKRSQIGAAMLRRRGSRAHRQGFRGVCFRLRTLASFGPDAADLLLRRMTALDLDRNEIARIEPQTVQDMQRVCIMCEHHRRCAQDFARDSANDAWKEYCPNAATLIALNALPWAAA